MKCSYRCLLAAALAVTPGLGPPPAGAQAGPPSPEALQAQVSDLLSFASGGLLGSADHKPHVQRDGETYHISIPLPGLTTPPNATINAIATPLDTGVWDITSLTLPDAGSLQTSRPDPDTGGESHGVLAFSIGHQAIHARIDPSLATASPFAAELGNVTLRTETGGRLSTQTLGHYTLEGTVTGDIAGRVNLQSQNAAADWRISATDPAGATTNSVIASAAGNFNVEGLDRAQAARLLQAGQAFAKTMQAARSEAADTPTPRTPRSAPPLSPAMRVQLRAMVDASDNLLTRLEAEDTLQHLHIQAAGGQNADIAQVRFSLNGEAHNDRLDARLAVKVLDLSLAGIPADFAAFVPRRIDITPALSGVHIDQVMRLLRDATAPDPDQLALRAEAIALLDDPNARVGIDTVSFEAGPLHLQGSARLLPQNGSTPALDIHLTATGLDALIAKVQGNPRVQQILPMVFLAKGMARSQGDSLVWDITLGDRGAIVNGVPLGQPPAARR